VIVQYLVPPQDAKADAAAEAAPETKAADAKPADQKAADATKAAGAPEAKSASPPH